LGKYKLKALRPALKFGPIGRPTGGEAAAKARSAAAEGWKRGRRSRRPKAFEAQRKSLQGRADLRALTQPDPAAGWGSPRKKQVKTAEDIEGNSFWPIEGRFKKAACLLIFFS